MIAILNQVTYQALYILIEIERKNSIIILNYQRFLSGVLLVRMSNSFVVLDYCVYSNIFDKAISIFCVLCGNVSYVLIGIDSVYYCVVFLMLYTYLLQILFDTIHCLYWHGNGV